MSSSDQLEKANEIGRKILSGQAVSEAEYRYMVMFNLTAITQLLWEISNQTQRDPSLRKAKGAGPVAGSRGWIGRLFLLVPPLIGFMAGFGIGYLVP